MTIQVTLDDAAVRAALAQLARNVSDMQPAMAGIGAELAGLIQEQLNQGGTPWGDPFATLSDGYMAALPRRRGGIPLNDTHRHIMNRVNAHVGNGFVEVGILDNPETPGLAIAHQFGSDRNGLPARPYLPIRNNQADLPQDWADGVMDVILRHLMDGVQVG